MAAPASVDDLLDLACKSGILTPEVTDSYLQRHQDHGTLPRSPKMLARAMIADGLLTRFQAEQLLLGKWRNFTVAGKYRLLDRLGAGGGGQVFLCEHLALGRKIALKVLPPAQAQNATALERFYREGRAVAALDHANIVKVHDIDNDGKLHFLVMEYVDGLSLHELVKKKGRLDVTRACHYIKQAAEGLQHAHEQGLVHRDVKPGNLLLDRSGTIKVLDLGLARFFRSEPDASAKEEAGQPILGTADYLAPEQALNSHAVDIRADVYSLGATFYFLLTGSGPFPEGSLAQKLIWHQVREPQPVRQQRPEVGEELAAVLARMMAKDRDKRYQTPAEVAAALTPFCQQPVPPPAEDELPRLSRAQGGSSPSPRSAPAHPVGGVGPRPVGAQGIRTPPKTSVSAPAPPAPVSGPEKRTDKPAVPVRPARRVRIRPIWVLGAGLLLVLGLVGLGGSFVWGMIFWAQQLPAAQATNPSWSWTPPEAPPSPEEIATKEGLICSFAGLPVPVEKVIVTSDGTRALSAGRDNNLRLWNMKTGYTAGSFKARSNHVRDVAYTADDKQVLAAEQGGVIRLWNLADATEAQRYEGHRNKVNAVAIAPDGKRFLSGGGEVDQQGRPVDCVLRLWDLVEGQELGQMAGHTDEIVDVAFSPDGKCAASASEDGTVRVWELAAGKEVYRLGGANALPVRAVTFSPDGRYLASAGADHRVHLWEAGTGKPARVLEGHTAAVNDLAFTRDGRHLLSASHDKTIRLWAVDEGKEVKCLSGHTDTVWSVAVAPDGRHAVSAGLDKTLRLWGLPPSAAVARAASPR